MSNTIIVINAGSLSLKFGAYAIGAGRALEVLCGLRIDHRLGDPHFIAKNPDGKPLGAHMWLLRIGNRSQGSAALCYHLAGGQCRQNKSSANRIPDCAW